MNPFTQPNDSPMPSNALGLWLGYRKLITRGYVPDARERIRLANTRPYQAVIDWELGPEQTDSFFTTTPGYFAVWGIVGNTVQPEGVEATIFDPERNRPMTDNPIVINNLVGTAQHPFFFRSSRGALRDRGGLYVFEPNTQILAKVANLSLQSNSGQIVLCGRILVQGQTTDADFPPAAEDTSQQYMQEPPWIKMPAAGEPFNPAASIPVPPIGATSTIVTHTVGVGRNSVVNRMANEIEGQPWVDGDGTLVWQFTKNGVPVKNQENIVSSLGAVNQPAPFGPFRAIENDVLALTITNVAMPVPPVPSAAPLARGRFDGWDYPKDLG
jgi:hypothetical protein